MLAKISASMMCADIMHLELDLRLLEENGVDYLHCDVMDGHFVQNWMLFPDMINRLSESSALPLDIHLMIDDPVAILDRLRLKKGDIISIHAESTQHFQRALSAIRDAGAIPAAALNPATSLCMIEDVLPDIGMLLIMTVNPGYAGQILVPQTLNKIKRARKMLNDTGYTHIPIEVDGNCSLSNTPMMIKAGAEIIVAGMSSIFDKKLGIARGVKELRAVCKIADFMS